MADEVDLNQNGQEINSPIDGETKNEDHDSRKTADTEPTGAEPEGQTTPLPRVPETKEDLRRRVRGIRSLTDIPSEDRRLMMAALVISFLDSKGCRKFYYSPKEPMISFDGMEYRVDRSDPKFSAFIYDIAHLNAISAEGKAVIHLLKNHINLTGQTGVVRYGIHTDLATNTVYVNLNNERDEILRIAPGRIEVIHNGEGPEGVFLLKSDAEPISYIPDVNVGEEMAELKELVFDNIPCCKEDRYFVLNWSLTPFLGGYARNRTILKMSGPSASGKSAAIKMILALLLGKCDLEASRVVKDLIIRGAISPILPLENVENRDLTPSLVRFVLCAASGISLTRRKLYTDSDRITDRLGAYICVTSIEPFRHLELANRIFDVETGKEHFSESAFDETQIIRRILEARDRILSAIFKLLAEVILPNLAETRNRIMRHLKERHPGHFTQRCDESTALTSILARVLHRYFEGVDDNGELLNSWVTAQDRKGRYTAQETSPLANMLAILRNEYETLHPEEFRHRYNLRVQVQRGGEAEGRAWFECPTRDLLPAILTVSRRYGLKQPYPDAGTLAARLKSEEELLEKIGWRIEWGVKTIRGTKVHRFTFSRTTETESE